MGTQALLWSICTSEKNALKYTIPLHNMWGMPWGYVLHQKLHSERKTMAANLNFSASLTLLVNKATDE